MNKRENLLSLLRRKGFEEIPAEFLLCPSLLEKFIEKTGGALDYMDYFEMPWRNIDEAPHINENREQFISYYDYELKPGTAIDCWGVAHEPGSAEAKHMTYMRNPLRNAETSEDIENYPYPFFYGSSVEYQKKQVEEIHVRGLAAVGNMQCTVWETSWYLRSMEELMMDMMTDDPKASILLDKVTDISVKRAESFAQAGADIIFIGDDIGMQSTILMSESLYVAYIKPRHKRVIEAAKAINPEIIIFYHSCGFITPFIPHLIDIGVDVLNPVQPECMDFEDIYKQYGSRLSFHGTLGTQTTIPFGTPEEIRAKVFENLDIAGPKGGLFIAPTHLLEPEVPWENILAYVKACREYKPR